MRNGRTAFRRIGIPSVSRSLHVLAAVAVAAILGVTAHQLLSVRRAIIADTERQMTRLDMVFAEQTGRAVETVDFILRNAIETLQTLRSRPPVDKAAFDALLRQRIARVQQVSEIVITDAKGEMLYSSRPVPPAAPPPVRSLITERGNRGDSGVVFSQPVRGANGKWTSLMLRPIFAHDGTFEGAAIAYLNLRYFEDFYRAVELSENGAILLHLRDGTVLARYPHKDAVVGTSYAELPPFKDILAHGLAGTVVMDSPIDGQRRVLAIRALKAFPLAVNVSVAQGRVLEAWRQQTWTFSFVAAGASVAIVLLLLLVAQRSRQVEALLAEYRGAKDAAEEANRQLIEQMAERERAEAALRQAQRIEAVGQLTGGVAHDFNNLLTVLIGNIGLMQDSGQLDPALAERLRAMRAAADRGAVLTGHLLAFARRQPLSPRAVDLNAVVAGMRDLLQSALGQQVHMDMRLASGLWPALVDPTQIELVILNLAINARDAMPNGGTVTIETANRPYDPPARPESPPAGDYVALTVRDVGTGMTAEVLARAFEPFFTTKGPGAGSGLGLSQVFGTARQSGGDVQIDSTPGKGTAVTVFLPRAAAPAEGVSPRLAETVQPRPATSAVVLVVDDDAAVRTTTADVLEALGYSVVQAANGAAALEVLSGGSDIDVVLTDVIMTGMSGPELARRAAALFPQLPIVFISGYADPAGIAGVQDRHRLIKKPFRPADLRAVIEAALAPSRTPAA